MLIIEGMGACLLKKIKIGILVPAPIYHGQQFLGGAAERLGGHLPPPNLRACQDTETSVGELCQY